FEVSGVDDQPTGITIKDNTLTALDFTFEKTDDVVSLSATGVNMDLKAGSRDILKLKDGSAQLQVSQAGFVGKFAMTVDSHVSLPGVTITLGAVELEVNTTNDQVTLGDGTKLDAGPYVHAAVSNVDFAFSKVDLKADSFAFTVSGQTVAVDAEGVDMTVGSVA